MAVYSPYRRSVFSEGGDGYLWYTSKTATNGMYTTIKSVNGSGVAKWFMVNTDNVASAHRLWPMIDLDGKTTYSMGFSTMAVRGIVANDHPFFLKVQNDDGLNTGGIDFLEGVAFNKNVTFKIYNPSGDDVLTYCYYQYTRYI